MTRARLAARAAIVLAALAAAVLAFFALRSRDDRESDEPAGLSSEDTAGRPEARLLGRPPTARESRGEDRTPAASSERADRGESAPRPFNPKQPYVTDVKIVEAATGLPLPSEEYDATSVRRHLASTNKPRRFAPMFRDDAGRWVADDPAVLEIAVPTVPTATSMRAVLAVRRVVELRVRAEDAVGHTIPDAQVVAWAIGDDVLGRAYDVPGYRGIRSVPFFPGQPVWVHAAADPRHFPAAFSAKRVSGDDKLHASARIDLPETFQSPLDVVVRFDEEHVFGDDDMPFEESLGEGGVANGRATLRVRVLRRDGTAAAHAALDVEGQRTAAGEDGVAVVAAPAVRDVEIHLVEPGMVPTTEVLDLRATSSLDVVVQEPEPASLDVVVVFGDGRPAPFARLSFKTPSGVAPLDLVDGIVRVDPYVGADGRRTYSRVEPAQVTVHAIWGSRAASVVADLQPGAQREARIVLPDASKDAPRGFRNTN